MIDFYLTDHLIDYLIDWLFNWLNWNCYSVKIFYSFFLDFERIKRR